MLDRERILSKIDALDGYVAELRAIAPASLAEYRKTEKLRACERLVQVAIESVLDVCQLMASGLRLGLPDGESDLFEKLRSKAIISAEMLDLLRHMRGCRNILVHEYTRVNDEIVFDVVANRLSDFDAFKHEILVALE